MKVTEKQMIMDFIDDITRTLKLSERAGPYDAIKKAITMSNELRKRLMEIHSD